MVVTDRQAARRSWRAACAPPGQRSAARLIGVLCVGVALAMTGSMAVATLLPTLMRRWDLHATDAGWLVGVFFVTYAVAAPLLACLSDRIDPRRIVIPSCLASGLCLLAADRMLASYAGGLLIQAMLGLTLAGTYVPSCRIAADHLRGTARSRGQSWLSATLIAGNALSVLLAGLASMAGDGTTWLALLAVGPLAAGLLLAAIIPPAPPRVAERSGEVFNLLPLLRERELMRSVLAFALHCFESYGLRAWLVAFLALGGGLDGGFSAPTVAALIVLLSGPAAVLGNEIALRFGPTRTVALVMAASAAMAFLLAAGPGLSGPPLMLALAAYAALTMADAGTLTSGTIDAAPAERIGAALALQATLAFISAATAPVVIGLAIDLGGGIGTERAWSAAFALLALCGVLGTLLMLPAGRPGPGATSGR